MTQQEFKRLSELRASIYNLHYCEFAGRCDSHDSMPQLYRFPISHASRSENAYAVYSEVEQHLADALNLLNNFLEGRQPADSEKLNQCLNIK